MSVYRKRFLKAFLLLVLVAAVGLLIFARTGSPRVDRLSRKRSAARAVAWLRTQQQSDGSFGSLTLTAEMVEAISDTGEDVRSREWTPDGVSLYQALEDQTGKYMEGGKRDAGVIARILLGVIAAGGNPRRFAGYDLVKALKLTYNSDSALYHETNMFRNSLAMLALARAGESVPERAVSRTFVEKRSRGCWGWQIGGKACDTDTTAVTMLALAANGVKRDRMEDVLQFLWRKEHRDAGWGSWDDQTVSNVDSTALVLLALKAFGENPRGERWSRRTFIRRTNPLKRLLEFQHKDGSFWYLDDQEGGKLLATCDALLAVAQSYPGDEK